MRLPDSISTGKLRQASAHIQAGQKDSARRILRDILIEDNHNLPAWELLTRATKNEQELVYCLQRILSIQPDHPWAGEQLVKATAGTNNRYLLQDSLGLRGSMIDLRQDLRLESSSGSPARSSKGPASSTQTRAASRSRQRRNKPPIFLYLSGVMGIVCLAVWGYFLFTIKFPLQQSSQQLTLTAAFMEEVDCQVLIEQAMQSAGSSCNQLGPNSVCYGNFTLQAELVPGAQEQFTQQGDIIDIQHLRRLSAAPMNIDAHEWGIAIFKVMANLPRSLPGQTVTLMVFGNTSISNESPNLETFFFSSNMGQLVCDQVPFDGIMINTPEGSGVRFNINSTELILMGNASLKAVPGESMEVSLFSGSGRIVANGQEQYFGAGQMVSVELGGENGMQAVSGPSAPLPLSQAELDLACTMSGHYCTESEVIPVSLEEARAEIMDNLASTITISPTPIPTLASTLSPTATQSPTGSSTASSTATRTRTNTPSPTITRTPTRTSSRTPPNPPIWTPTASNTPTPTTSNTPTPTASNTPTPTPVCSGITAGPLILNGLQLDFDITNATAGSITISSAAIGWEEYVPQQDFRHAYLDGIELTSDHDNDPDTTIPGEIPWAVGPASREIAAGDSVTFTASFHEPVSPTGNSITLSFTNGCVVSGGP